VLLQASLVPERCYDIVLPGRGATCLLTLSDGQRLTFLLADPAGEVLAELFSGGWGDEVKGVAFKDLTGDGFPEIVVVKGIEDASGAWRCDTQVFWSRPILDGRIGAAWGPDKRFTYAVRGLCEEEAVLDRIQGILRKEFGEPDRLVELAGRFREEGTRLLFETARPDPEHVWEVAAMDEGLRGHYAEMLGVPAWIRGRIVGKGLVRDASNRTITRLELLAYDAL